MENKFKISILTPSQLIYSGEAVSLVVSAYYGYLGILANHAPLIARIIPGKITIRVASKEYRVIISRGEGLVEVSDNNVNILLDNAEAV